MRSTCTLALVALLTAGTAMGQVIVQAPASETAQTETRQERQAREVLRDAERRPVRGDYYGPAEMQPDARQAGRNAAPRPRQHSSTYYFGR